MKKKNTCVEDTIWVICLLIVIFIAGFLIRPTVDDFWKERSREQDREFDGRVRGIAWSVVSDNERDLREHQLQEVYISPSSKDYRAMEKILKKYSSTGKKIGSGGFYK